MTTNLSPNEELSLLFASPKAKVEQLLISENPYFIEALYDNLLQILGTYSVGQLVYDVYNKRYIFSKIIQNIGLNDYSPQSLLDKLPLTTNLPFAPYLLPDVISCLIGHHNLSDKKRSQIFWFYAKKLDRRLKPTMLNREKKRSYAFSLSLFINKDSATNEGFLRWAEKFYMRQRQRSVAESLASILARYSSKEKTLAKILSRQQNLSYSLTWSFLANPNLGIKNLRLVLKLNPTINQQNYQEVLRAHDHFYTNSEIAPENQDLIIKYFKNKKPLRRLNNRRAKAKKLY